MTAKPNALSATQMVAYEITRVSGGEEDGEQAFNRLDEETKASMMEIAHAAIMAHQAWLLQTGFRLVPPGLTVRPQSEEEAHAMAKAVRDFLDQPEHAKQRRQKLVAAPAIVLPSGFKPH